MQILLFPKRKLATRIVLYSLVLLTLCGVYFVPRFKTDPLYTFSISQPKNELPFAYDDKEQGGNSSSEVIKGSESLNIRFHLENQFVYPYAGLSFPVESDVSRFNTLHLSIQVPKEMGISIIFSEHKKESVNRPLHILQHADYLLPCTPETNEYFIPISSFQIPIWWRKSNHKVESIFIDWSKINTLSIQNDPAMPNGVDQTFSISVIDLKNHSQWPLYGFFGFLFLVVMLEYFLHKMNRPKTEIRYVPIEQGELNSKDPWDIVAGYVARHYREDINLETIYLETGIGKHKISSLIKHNALMNVREYINKIRIQEAERLFRQTSFGITEIGYEVGFSSATQFNRVFKEIKGVAPSEYKKSLSQ